MFLYGQAQAGGVANQSSSIFPIVLVVFILVVLYAILSKNKSQTTGKEGDYNEKQMFEKAISYYDDVNQFTRETGNNLDMYINKGPGLLSKLDEVLSMLIDIEKLNPDILCEGKSIDWLRSYTYALRGSINNILGKCAEAIIDLKKSLKINEYNDTVHYILVLVYLETNNVQDAIKHLNKAIELDPHNETYLSKVEELNANKEEESYN